MKKVILDALIVLTCTLGLSAVTTSFNPVVSAAPAKRVYVNDCKNQTFLTFKAWNAGLCDASGKEVGIDKLSDNSGLKGFIWTIVLNVVDDIFQLIGYVSAGFLIYGGYLWIFAQGKPEMITKGRQTITNAIVGLVIALFATLIVNVILGLF